MRPTLLLRRPAVVVVAGVSVIGLLTGAARPAAASGPSTTTVDNIAADADWLLQGQLPDGAIAWYIDRTHISPYLGNYAAIGLAEARKQTGVAGYSDAAWSWLHWYAAHQDANGFVTDYDVDASGTETSTGDEDSTDAYAGTYLSAVRATYLADPDATELVSLHTSIAAAVGAIEATQDADGLTWAKPDWHVKYLMDQTEAYDGLASAADLAAALSDDALRRRAADNAAQLSAGIASLWDAPTGAYDWAKNDGGGLTTTNWSMLYPDAMEQAWLAGSTAVSKNRAGDLVGTLQQTEPQWSSPNAAAEINGTVGTVGYWPVAGWALLRINRLGPALSAASSIRAGALGNDRAWPFTTANAGQLIVLESGDRALIAP